MERASSYACCSGRAFVHFASPQLLMLFLACFLLLLLDTNQISGCRRCLSSSPVARDMFPEVRDQLCGRDGASNPPREQTCPTQLNRESSSFSESGWSDTISPLALSSMLCRAEPGPPYFLFTQPAPVAQSTYLEKCRTFRVLRRTLLRLAPA